MMKINICLFFLIILFATIPQLTAHAENSSTILEDGHTLHASFLDFSFSRINVINKNYIHTPENIFIEPVDALFVARYRRVEPASISVEVRQTGSARTPFIGVLKYTESVYESNGGCRIGVVEGPFNPVRHRRVTEIFRYVQNRWQ
jgi:hypothetical protein